MPQIVKLCKMDLHIIEGYRLWYSCCYCQDILAKRLLHIVEYNIRLRYYFKHAVFGAIFRWSEKMFQTDHIYHQILWLIR